MMAFVFWLNFLSSVMIFVLVKFSCGTECPDGQIVGVQDNCYLVVDGTPVVLQQDARSYCNDLDMDLVAIETAKENQFIQVNVTSESAKRNFWIGLASGLYGGGGGGFASSSSVWQSYQMLSDGTAFQEFSVKTRGNDARVRLTDNIDGDGNSYEIALGSNNDSVVTITKCRMDEGCIRKRRKQLTGLFGNSKRERLFMVKCYRGLVTVNTIDNLSPHLHLVAGDKVDPIPCKYVGFASGSGYTIEWSYWRRFSWSSGSNAGFMNWMRQSPKGEPKGDRCVIFKSDTSMWKDVDCNQRNPFICESTPRRVDVSLSSSSDYSGRTYDNYQSSRYVGYNSYSSQEDYYIWN